MKDIFSFLNDLSLHNDREWMQEHKPQYQQAKKQVQEVVASLIEGVTQFDPAIMGLTPKDCLFRLHRDTRFSKDKTPYKTNFGASIKEGGRKSIQAGYYLHLQPGNSFVGGGTYMPAATELKKIRQEIDYCGEEFRSIIEEPEFVKTFGEIYGERLKTAPKGYPKDHPDIDLLRLKSFVVLRPFSDREVMQKYFLNKALEVCQQLKPMNDFINRSFD
ncbi:DUF2461 domain-containing protein [Algivirga pacifica]|uniref:DUF2461 domain-containing protein n=1 Tax=Algivirga pacifica TaxID=1162670 RepID=A0ABP9DBS7_9BACT